MSAVVLGRHRLYILPSRHGLAFGLALTVLLLAAVNYHNGLVFLLAFTLAGLGLVSMLYTHRNLARLAVLPGPCAPVFAGEEARFGVCLANDSAFGSEGVWVTTPEGAGVRVTVPAHSQVCVEIPLPAKRRGLLAGPPLVVSSDYPLGLLRSWSRAIRLGQQCLVYPRPAPAQPGSARAREPGGWRTGSGGGDDFVGLAPFRPGDSPHHISWKAVARGQGMLVKRFGGGGRETVWLDWEELAAPDPETRLSLLTRMLLDAEAAGDRYGLKLPHRRIAPDRGEAHRHACLQALALFPGPAGA